MRWDEIQEFAKQILSNFFVQELIVILVSLRIKDDLRKFQIFLTGTIVVAAIAFWPNFGLIQPESSPETNAPVAEATDGTTAEGVSSPTPPPSPHFTQIGIERWSELYSPGDNLGLLPGRNVLAGIPFDNGWTVTTQCDYLPNQQESYFFAASVEYPQRVYFILQTGYGETRYLGQRIGYIQLFFENGDTAFLHLVLGENIRDWKWGNTEHAVTTTTAPYVKPAWQGSNSDGNAGGMDMLTFEVPLADKASTLIGIEIGDLSQINSGGINPCIHLLAITVESLQ